MQAIKNAANPIYNPTVCKDNPFKLQKKAEQQKPSAHSDTSTQRAAFQL